MTLEELFNSNLDVWEKLSDKELEDICRPWFPKTRPDMLQLNTSFSSQEKKVNPERKAVMEKLKGLNLDPAVQRFLMKNGKR
jgi:hypothetical protein